MGFTGFSHFILNFRSYFTRFAYYYTNIYTLYMANIPYLITNNCVLENQLNGLAVLLVHTTIPTDSEDVLNESALKPRKLL